MYIKIVKVSLSLAVLVLLFGVIGALLPERSVMGTVLFMMAVVGSPICLACSVIVLFRRFKAYDVGFWLSLVASLPVYAVYILSYLLFVTWSEGGLLDALKSFSVMSMSVVGSTAVSVIPSLISAVIYKLSTGGRTGR